MFKVLATVGAPQAIGPYIQGAKFGNMVITSGQLPVDPVTGNIPSDISQQTQQSLENVLAIIKEAGLTASNIVKVTVFLQDMNNFSEVNNVYERFFLKNGAGFPARSCVQVARLPKNAGIEIEAIACS
ncbi:reactive intermediate/imine deaminase [Salmonella enterica subsp. diarizonae]|nr:reactive intermediate/imine deaminase [Salmonella enterica subsp. diarizonae]